MNRIAYLNCEVKSRDLSTRLLVATHLLKMGVPVVVGQVWALIANAQARKNIHGVYLFATTNKFQAKGMGWVKAGGHFVIASDEEILPAFDPIPFVTPEALQVCDKFLIDTPDHADALSSKYPNLRHKFAVAGPVRLEALETIDIQPASTSPYILINTGSGVINSIRGNPHEAVQILRRAVDVSEEEAWMRVKAGQAAFDLMVPLIRWLAPSHRVVVRPHPAERADTWRQAVPEAEIIEGSAPLPWIKGARVVIHNNSTTGIEAAAMGVPALNLDPYPEWGKRYLAPTLNHTVDNLADAQSALESLLSGNGGPLAEKAKAELNFPKYGARNTAQAIFDVLKDSPPISGQFPWAMMEREALDRAKFTVTAEEVAQIIDGLNVSCVTHQLDDSVFLFTPNA